MKINQCYYCGSDHNTFYAEENGFHLVKCDKCGLLFINERPDDSEITEAHRQGVHGGNKSFDMTGKYNPSNVSWYQNVLKDLFNKEELGRKKTWLDVGCGNGEFMEAVQKHSSGILVKGSEPNVRKQQAAVKRGLDVDYFEIDTHTEKYDVVSMLNVYSHLPNPPAFLRSLKRIIKPNGELILETGDTADRPASEQYRPFYLPDHLSFASQRIVVDILEQIGFEILCVKKYPFLRADFVTFAKELVKAIMPQYNSRVLYYLKNARIDMYIRAKLKSE